MAGTSSVSAAFTVLGGDAYAVGDAQSGKLGNGSDADVLTATEVPLVFPSPIVSLASGSNFSLALLEDGSVWSVGSNVRGQLGDGTTATGRATWAKIPSLSNVSQIGAGETTGYALRDDHSVLAWGRNDVGQLGNNASGDTSTPVRLTLLSTVTQIAAGRSSGYALMDDATVRAWGYNGVAQLGDGTTTTSRKPVAVTGLTSVAQLSAGVGGCYALRKDGTVRAWGANDYGQLGNGTTVSSSGVPVTVSGLSGVGKVAAAGYNGYALMGDATLRAWGTNSEGNLGNGTYGGFSTTPVAVQGLSGVLDVAGGSVVTYAMMDDRTVRAWGWNNHGQAGDGTTTRLATPTTMSVVGSVEALMTNSPTSLSGFFVRREPGGSSSQ